ncbi:hypothetical protein [Pseudomonas aeruginosa]|uniref:hypothetical protein n=1 Tax=Pseudomonas aeruginosa TaxID=287 RepID=UPI002953D5A9|nr:hypothetical protein [Pseudomonas aeruginosa]MDV8060598.1 hypothetical protein [Pseudomonas aeruginosa]MDV8087698.1 hypothetical protein [Pseudomonas aeruginosa]
MTNINKLKELAVRALPFAPGEWFVENGIDQVRDCANDFVCETGEDEPIKASFIAAANPQAILGLIAEVERLRSRLEIDERIPHDGISCRDETIKALDEKCDKLKAENEALLLGMRAILNAYDYADQYNKEGVAVEVMEDLRTLFKGATQ